MAIKRRSRPAPKAAAGATAGRKLIKGKAGEVIGKIGGLASRFGGLIPGIGGIVSTVGKVAESLNDPWWWSHVQGNDGVSTNVPLIPQNPRVEGIYTASVSRPAILEFTAVKVVPGVQVKEGGPSSMETAAMDDYLKRNWADKGPAALSAGLIPAITPRLTHISSYLMQNIRKVVNAIPLQSPEAYREVFINAATAYALRKQLDKLIWLSKHAQPHIPAIVDGSYPVLAPENYAVLVGMRDRLADYLSASVRLPHTLCQYLSWRFGHVFKTGPSAKTGMVLYDVIPLSASLSEYVAVVNAVLGFATNTTATYLDTVTVAAKTSAMADMYNAYLKHVQDVGIPDEDQYRYDPKEFVLRTNLDVGIPGGASLPDPEFIYMDSDLDNKTTFMASTVSTIYSQPNDGPGVLFPVRHVIAHCPSYPGSIGTFNGGSTEADTCLTVKSNATVGSWYMVLIGDAINGMTPAPDQPAAARAGILAFAVAPYCKALEFYNAELYGLAGGAVVAAASSPLSISDGYYYVVGRNPWVDTTALSQDLALVSGQIIENTQTYAFANLVYEGCYSTKAEETPKAIAEAQVVANDIVRDLTESK